MPLRIADDWEERNIVLEDIKALLELERISDARELLNEMSSDWQSLTADSEDWESRQSNPRFLGAWHEHRRIYGYTLRAELVYRLKQALEQRGDFELDQPLRYLVVDEYQDLNRCDLAVVRQIEGRGVELFVAGDDDQSIYGFRKAHPEGIRRFPDEYANVTNLELEICKRCDRSILELGLFVARQDHLRIEKTIRNDPESGEGEVAILRFDDQDSEARGIAELSSTLLDRFDLDPSNILVLLRADRNGSFSSLIRDKLEEAGIPVATATNAANPLDDGEGRSFLAFLRLVARLDDSLAWRTLFENWCSGVGPGAIGAIYDLARGRGESFAQTVLAAHNDDVILPSTHRTRLRNAISNVIDQIGDIFPENVGGEQYSEDELLNEINSAMEAFDADLTDAIPIFERAIQGSGATSIQDLLRALGTALENIEPDIEDGKVNILTMHRAKGLTAEIVIVAAAEDEQIPGRAVGEETHDERRLLYVSLTRAKHHLFVTYCDRRTGQQQHTGRDSGNPVRSLTQFLSSSPHSPQDGRTFVSNY